jgi:hypothetical protein
LLLGPFEQDADARAGDGRGRGRLRRQHRQDLVGEGDEVAEGAGVDRSLLQAREIPRGARRVAAAEDAAHHVGQARPGVRPGVELDQSIRGLGIAGHRLERALVEVLGAPGIGRHHALGRRLPRRHGGRAIVGLRQLEVAEPLLRPRPRLVVAASDEEL